MQQIKLKDINTTTIDRLPPQNIEAEEFVLGAIILDNEALSKIIEIINVDDFYKDSHKHIFKAMTELFNKNEPIDIVTLVDYLRKTGEIEQIGGIGYLSSLANSIPTSANIKYHAKIIREKSLLRTLIRAGTDVITRVYEDSMDVDEMVDYAEKIIFDIANKKIKEPFSTIRDVMKGTIKTIDQLYERKEVISGASSGFNDLDELTSGFQQGDLIVIGGRPGMGKTAFALNIAQNVAVKHREPVAIFSLEMSKEQLGMRLLCSESMIDASKIRKNMLSKEEYPRLSNAAGRLAEASMFIDDSSAITALEIRAKSRRLKLEHGGLSLIIVDYLQLMRGRGNFDRREQEISEISRSLKALAKELKVPIIALSQLNRAVEGRGSNKRPILADLRESGAIEQDADVIIFIYRDEIYNRNNPLNKGKAEIIVEKQRNGPSGVIVNLTFIAGCTKFVNFTVNNYPEEEEVY